VEHLDCFYSLAIVNNVAVNMGMQVDFIANLTYIPLGISLKAELLNPMEVLFLVF
jgi:hypothetical protein